MKNIVKRKTYLTKKSDWKKKTSFFQNRRNDCKKEPLEKIEKKLIETKESLLQKSTQKTYRRNTEKKKTDEKNDGKNFLDKEFFFKRRRNLSKQN